MWVARAGGMSVIYRWQTRRQLPNRWFERQI